MKWGAHTVHAHDTVCQPIVTKAAIIRRIGLLLKDLKRMTAQSRFLGEDCEDLTVALHEVEKQYGRLVDDYMAGLLQRYLENKKR